VYFRLLGLLEVIGDDGESIAVGRGNESALLGVLLVEANRVVSTDRLIDALWEEAPPEAAGKALQVYVSRLRKVLGKERLQTRAPGYMLRVAEGELDLERFRNLAEQKEFHEALALWRGPPLADFAYQRFAQGEIARLEELCLACLEERVEQDLAAGRHAALVGELEALVSEHPLRERFRGQLMLALYRSGRQAEALDAYQVGRRLLSDELGLEPGEILKSQQRAMLAHDASLNLAVERVAAPEAPAALKTPPPMPEPVGREVRKTITVVFAALMTSTDQGRRLDPEAQRRVTSRAFAEIGAAVERHGGTLETLAGDAVTAVFGIPAVHEDDTLRAVRTAAEAREHLTALGDELASHWAARLDFRIGLSTGEVIAGGEVGPHPHPTGEPMTAAALLGWAAEPGDILLDEAAYRFVREAVDVEAAGVAFRLVAVHPDAPGHPSRFESPMVGRVRERRRLHDAFEQAVGDGSCQLFTILGVAGVGKSRLVQEFLGDLAGQALVARGRCLPYGEGITYWPVMEVVKEAAGFEDAATLEESRLKLVALMEGEEQGDVVARRVAETIGLTEAVGQAEESFWAVTAFFEVLARRRPLVLVFDDIHWGEATFLDLVENLADWTRDAPILLVCLARSELLDVRPGWGGGKLNATSILLEPLSEEESTRLVDNLASGALGESARGRIVEAAEGNPLFVEEMLALAMEDGRGDGELDVPPTIQALLAARLDRLSDDERLAIEAASVEGKVFHERSVAERLPEGLRPSVREHLMTLVRKELIRPDKGDFSGERGFRFRHLLIRDAAYESIPKRTRAAFHERHAAWLEGKAGQLAEWEEILGYHLEQAFRYRAELGPIDEEARGLARRAAERLAAAGRRAFVRSDARAAVNLLSRAVSLLPSDDPARVDLVPTVRVAQGLGGDLGWAVEVLDEAIGAGDDRLRAHALVQRGLLRLFTGPDVDAEELIEIAERAIGIFEELGDDLGLARAWRLVAQANYLARRAGPSVEASERALVHARRAGDRFEEREIAELGLGVPLVLGPAPAPEAARRCEQLLGEAAGDPVLEANALGALAYLVAIQGRTAEARELLARGRGVMEVVGGWIWLHPVYFAFSAVWEGDPIAVERELRPGYEALTRIGENSHLSSLATVLAQAVYAQGRYEEAAELAREAREASRPYDVHCQTISRTVNAKVLARRGEPEAAEELAREAIAFVEQSDFLPAHAEALMDLAEILRLAGRPEEAVPVLKEALRLHNLKGNVVSATRVCALLDELR